MIQALFLRHLYEYINIAVRFCHSFCKRAKQPDLLDTHVFLKHGFVLF